MESPKVETNTNVRQKGKEKREPLIMMAFNGNNNASSLMPPLQALLERLKDFDQDDLKLGINK